MAAGLPYFLTPDAASAIFLLATILSTVCVLLGVKALGAQRKKQANRLRTQAAEAVSKAVGLSMLAVADTPPSAVALRSARWEEACNDRRTRKVLLAANAEIT